MVKSCNRARGQALAETFNNQLMKKSALLLLCGALVFCGCQKENEKETPSKDAELTGETVDVSSISTDFTKIFVLNEGGMGSNNSSLDFLRKSDANYVTGAFKKMNPDVAGGLGDVGNDVAVKGDQLWIVVNNSGIVEVLSAKDETELAAIQVPTPRNIAFDDKYAYVTSWAGAFATYSYTEDGYSSITDSSNPKGQLYRINLDTFKIEGQVEVGYQPEGVACYGGKIYVANSGGISSQLPPNYAYDNTVSVVDASTFKVSKTIDVEVNLKNAFSDGKGLIYVSTYGNYYSVHSGLYVIDTKNGDSVSKMGDYASVCTVKGGSVYCIGNENEFDWQAAAKLSTWKCSDGKVSTWAPGIEGGTPYGICVIDDNNVLIGDAGDYFNPGSVSLYSKGSKAWTVTAGVCPGHFAIY